MKKLRKILAMMLTLVMAMGVMSVGAFAAEITTHKSAEWADGTKTVADVKLAVPGDVEVKGADIVFVVDKSSCKTYTTAEFEAMFSELAAVQAKSGTDIKVGVVVFNYTDHVELPLTSLTSDNINDLLNQIAPHSNGTNMESGLLAAKEMLAADTTVDAENKYVILISDGLTWAYDDAAGEPHCILYKNGATSIVAGTEGYIQTRGKDYKLSPAFETMEEYMAQVKTWVEADGDTYSYSLAGYGTDAFEAGLANQGAIDIALTSAQGQEHATSMDRALYDAWLAYTDLQAAGYNCYVNNVSANKGNHIGNLFMNMLAGDQTAVDFESIQNKVIYAVAAGSSVKDYMGYSADAAEGYNYDFMVDGNVTMHVGENTYFTTKLETPNTGADASYTFAATEGGEPTFALDYYYGTGTDDEYFVWNFGEDVSNFAPVSLDYQVLLTTKQATPREEAYETYTNSSATLYDPDGEKLADFNDPMLSYEIDPPAPDPVPVTYYNITVNYFDKNTGATIASSYITAFEEGTVYNVAAQNAIAIDGYTYDSTDRAELLTGTLTGDVVINVFYVRGAQLPEPPVPLQPSDPSMGDFIIDEDDVPLADAPATGDPLTVMAAMSILSGAGVYFTRKKRDEE